MHNATRARLRAKVEARLGRHVVEERDRQLKQDFIDSILNTCSHIKYIGELSRKEVEDEYPSALISLDSKITGREILIEYHLFNIMDKIPMIQQRRVVS